MLQETVDFSNMGLITLDIIREMLDGKNIFNGTVKVTGIPLGTDALFKEYIKLRRLE